MTPEERAAECERNAETMWYPTTEEIADAIRQAVGEERKRCLAWVKNEIECCEEIIKIAGIDRMQPGFACRIAGATAIADAIESGTEPE